MYSIILLIGEEARGHHRLSDHKELLVDLSSNAVTNLSMVPSCHLQKKTLIATSDEVSALSPLCLRITTLLQDTGEDLIGTYS